VDKLRANNRRSLKRQRSRDLNLPLKGSHQRSQASAILMETLNLLY